METLPKTRCGCLAAGETNGVRGWGASAQNERILLVPLRGGGADPEESQRRRLLEGSGGEPFGGE